MTLKRIKYSVAFVVMFLSWVNFAYAGVIINEVQISPTGERFIELYNSGPSQDLTGWYIQRKTVGGINFTSLVTQPNFTDKTVEAGDYFLISKNLNSDIVLGEITLTESNTIQIKNSKGIIIDKVGWGDSTDCGNICAPNPTTGKSIQKTSNQNWIIADRTPRAINSGVSDTNFSDNSSEDNPVDKTIDTIPLIKENPDILKITTKIISPKIVTAGIPFSFSSLTATNRGETYAIGKFIWNFGDGMTREEGKSIPFEYIYQYPGEYVISLSYYDSAFSIKPDAIDRVTIKVIPSGINIIGVGTLADPYIEIENNSNYEMSLNKWILKGSVHSFMIPEGMVILPNKKLKLSPKITGFDFNDLSSIIIIDQSGQVFATYPKQKIYQDVPLIKYSVSKSPQENVIKSDSVTNNQIEDIANSPDVINLNDLGANAINSNDLNNLSKGFYAWLGLIIIIIVGIISIILIRRKKEYPDYIEEKITANDMKIIE